MNPKSLLPRGGIRFRIIDDQVSNDQGLPPALEISGIVKNIRRKN